MQLTKDTVLQTNSMYLGGSFRLWMLFTLLCSNPPVEKVNDLYRSLILLRTYRYNRLVFKG